MVHSAFASPVLHSKVHIGRHIFFLQSVVGSRQLFFLGVVVFAFAVYLPLLSLSKLTV